MANLKIKNNLLELGGVNEENVLFFRIRACVDPLVAGQFSHNKHCEKAWRKSIERLAH